MEQPNTRGRPVGAPNKVTRLSKENITEAFELLGGVDGMVQWAMASNQNLTEFYKIYAKLLPRQLDVKNDGNPLSLTVVRYENLPRPMKTVSASVIHDSNQKLADGFDDAQLLEQARNDLELEKVSVNIDMPDAIENHSHLDDEYPR